MCTLRVKILRVFGDPQATAYRPPFEAGEGGRRWVCDRGLRRRSIPRHFAHSSLQDSTTDCRYFYACLNENLVSIGHPTCKCNGFDLFMDFQGRRV